MSDLDPEDQTPEDESDVAVNAHCFFDKNGATRNVCRRFTTLMRYNQQCCATQCKSEYRSCWACLAQGHPENVAMDATSGLCIFHIEFGEKAVLSELDILNPYPQYLRSLEKIHVEPEPERIIVSPIVRQLMPKDVRLAVESVAVHAPSSPSPTRLAARALVSAVDIPKPAVVKQTETVVPAPPEVLAIIEEAPVAPPIASVIEEQNFPGLKDSPWTFLDEIERMMSLQSDSKKYTINQIWLKTGFSGREQEQLLSLSSLIPEVREFIRDPAPGTVVWSVAAAFEIAKMPPEEQVKWARLYLEGEVTLRRLRNVS